MSAGAGGRGTGSAATMAWRTGRRLSPVAVAVRAVIALAGTAALVTAAGPGDAPGVFVVVAAVSVAVAVAVPDSAAAAVATGAVVVVRLAAHPAGIDGRLVATALALLALHLAAALAAAFPLRAAVGPDVLRPWYVPAAVLTGATLAGLGLLALTAAHHPPASLVLSAAALAILAALTRWWSRDPGSGF